MNKEIESTEGIILTKNEILTLNSNKFYVKNCEPSSGVITKNSQIKFENKEILGILKLQLAVLNNHSESYLDEKVLQKYIHNQYYKPYFLSGVKRYIEKGEVIKIDDIEFFILNAFPEEGFILPETQIYYKYNLTKEKCLEKINESDMKYALQLARHYEREEMGIPTNDSFSSSFSNFNNMGNLDTSGEIYLSHNNRFVINNSNISQFISRIINRNIEDRNLLSSTVYDRQESQEDNHDIELFICNLPELVVDSTYLKFIEEKKLKVENITKCMICFCEFELNEVLKTLPCSKIYYILLFLF